MSRIKLFLASLFLLGSLNFVSSPTYAYNPLDSVCKKAGGKGPVCEQNAKQQADKSNPVVRQIRAATNIIALAAGFIAVIIIILGGFMFVTSGGNVAGGQRAGDSQGRAKQGRQYISGAVIGLIIIALAWSIVTLVTNAVIK